ncbi:magnesium and cobalt transport protein CorA [Corynebacterium sp. TAE3-ERU12]|uniref:magnesium and cobalt transport protein CorA n=1 Tax=Corynebacterium sp. TAE3-ERU12 TaxID=2849491 RepID=UPI001C44ECED|nr:magnesium and cobalt transport protein CorA [Corynebacterium sp. TAE3-ERU12]MBV7295070.1 magnesium and cobalt transport protein CorA [Corynebacterium sp. TAE3-ERU12]
MFERQATLQEMNVDNQPRPIPVQEATRDCAVYVDGQRLSGEWDHRTALAHVRETGEGFAWLSLSRPNEAAMDSIAETYGLDELTVEDALTQRQRPKVEIHDDHIVYVLRSVHYSPEGLSDDENEKIRTGQMLMVLGKDYIITIRHGSSKEDMKRLQRRVNADADLLKPGPAGVLWALTDMLVDNYLVIAHQLEGVVEDMEDQVFEPGGFGDIEDIYVLKRETLEMRHAIDPLTAALKLVLTLKAPLMPKVVRRYLGDVLDHQLVAADMIRGFDERLTSLIDAAAVKVSLQQNTDMRTISAYAAVLAVPTALAGIYGMNFVYMPELEWHYGYYAVLSVMGVTVVFLVWLLRRNKWL